MNDSREYGIAAVCPITLNDCVGVACACCEVNNIYRLSADIMNFSEDLNEVLDKR